MERLIGQVSLTMNIANNEGCGVSSRHGSAVKIALESYGFDRMVGAVELRSADG